MCTKSIYAGFAELRRHMISHCIIHVSAREALNLYIKNVWFNGLSTAKRNIVNYVTIGSLSNQFTHQTCHTDCLSRTLLAA
ncbi:hypothetical protein OS493_018666 [Desmophyllum pertusum]|uniref:Uncharacterized protein n=1 Tax=Desmophyllum pertusum TaxID=174260 RepID=A0A9W9ZNR3_9CNID|nr:hypothetical protein OS493_018666 [Desmophyllum pertusum]